MWTQTDHATSCVFKITYPLYKDVSLDYWQRQRPAFHLRRKWEKLRLRFTGTSGIVCALSTSDLPRGIAAPGATLNFARADTKVGAKSPGPIPEMRRKNRRKVMFVPLIDSGRGGRCNHWFWGSISVYPSSQW